MIWIRVFVIGSLLSQFEAHKHCTQLIKWRNLFQTLTNMSSGISKTCAHHYNKKSLCDPEEMLSRVELNATLLDHIMKKSESIYKKNPNHKHFIEALQHTRHMLKTCTHHLNNFDLNPVDICFNKLQAFIHSKSSHVDCAWEIVNVTVRELLLRLENRTFRR